MNLVFGKETARANGCHSALVTNDAEDADDATFVKATSFR